MRILRLFFWFYFVILSTIFLTVPIADIWIGTHPSQCIHVSPIVDLVSSVLGIIFLVASCIAWRERTSEKVRGCKWMISTSLSSLFISVATPVFYSYGRGVGA